MVESVVEYERFLDNVFSTFHWAIFVLGFTLNSIVLWLVITQKHNSIKQYRILLGNSTCTLLVFSLLGFFLQSRFVIVGHSVAYVPLGPARFLDMPRLVLSCTAMDLAIYIYAFMTIAMCMVYKYAAVSGKSPPSEKSLLMISGLFFLIPLSAGVASFIYEPNFLELYDIMDNLRPEYELQRYGHYSGLPNVKNVYSMYLIVLFCVVAVTSYIIMLAAGFRTRKLLTKKAEFMSTRNAHAFKLMALIIQSFLPVVFAFPSLALYTVLQFTSVGSIIAEYLTTAISPLVIVVDPCITLYYVIPYRRYVLRKLGLDKNSLNRTVSFTQHQERR